MPRTFKTKVSTPAGTTAGAPLNVPHGSAPTSPVDGDVWTTTAGVYARINGATVGPFGSGGGSVARIIPFSRTGVCAVVTGKSRLYVDASYTIQSVRASVNTAPTGTSLIVDVNKNGTTIFSTQGNRPTIAVSGVTSGTVTNMNTTSLTAGDYLTIDIDQVGSTVPGADLVVTVVVV